MSDSEDRPKVYCTACRYYGGLRTENALILCTHARAFVYVETPLTPRRLVQYWGDERNADLHCPDFQPSSSVRRFLRPGGLMLVLFGVLWVAVWLVVKGWR